MSCQWEHQNIIDEETRRKDKVEAEKNKELEKNTKLLRSEEITLTKIAIDKVFYFVGVVSTVAFFVQWKSQLLVWFPWLPLFSLNIELPFLEKIYINFITYVQPFIRSCIAWLTQSIPFTFSPWMYDYIFLNSILLSRPMSILFSELAIDSKLNSDTETKYRIYKALEFTSSLPPVYYALSLVIFVPIVIVIIVIKSTFTFIFSLITFGLVAVKGIFGVVFPGIDIFLVLALAFPILVFEIVELLFYRSVNIYLKNRFRFIGITVSCIADTAPPTVKLLGSFFGIFLVAIILALSPYFAITIAVYAVALYRILALKPTRTSTIRVVFAPWIHSLSILFGALLILMFVSTVSWSDTV